MGELGLLDRHHMPGHREGVEAVDHADHQGHSLVPLMRGVKRQNQGRLRPGLPAQASTTPASSAAAPGSKPSRLPPYPGLRNKSGHRRRRSTRSSRRTVSKQP